MEAFGDTEDRLYQEQVKCGKQYHRCLITIISLYSAQTLIASITVSLLT